MKSYIVIFISCFILTGCSLPRNEYISNDEIKFVFEKSRGEERVDWVIENMETFDGWCLTGKSMGKFDKDFKPARTKVGIINTDLVDSIDDEYDEERYRFIHDCDGWKRRGIIFGLSFRREF